MKWMNADEASVYLGFRNRLAFYRAVEKYGIPHTRIGRALRFSQAKLDAYMERAKSKEQPRTRAVHP